MRVNVKTAIKKLEKERAKVANARDELRELMDELVNQHDNWCSAVDSLDDAIERLSELV